MKQFVICALAVLCPLVIYSQYFSDVSNSNGLDSYAPSFAWVGTGVSFADFNNDGWDDLTFSTATGDDIFFLQNMNGVLTPIAPLVSHTEISKQILWADIDNDGDKDLFVTTYEGFNRLYENTGNMNMVDITAAAGLLVESTSKSNSAAFGDLDKDGFLDLYIVNIDFDSNFGYENRLYRNNGDLTFSNVTNATGTGNGHSYSLATAFLDIENDGDQDIYISNDRQYPNCLYRNDGNNTFTDYSAASNTNIVIHAMNVGVGDFDNDNDLDIYVTNNSAPPAGSALFQNDGNGQFTEVASLSGVKFLGRVGWGGNWFDMDNDLDLDLYVCSEKADDVNECNLIYENNGNGTFSTPLPNGLPGDHLNSYANAYGDFNNDGKIDFAVANSPYAWVSTPSEHKLWANVNSNSNNWIKIDLEGTVSNKDGVGSWVELHTGGQKYLRYKHCGQSYLGQNADFLHFGLGSNIKVDSITVKWLSGNKSRVVLPQINSRISIVEGENNALANDLLSFDLKSIRNESAFELNWIAENEESTVYYQIQKSEDGIRYENLDVINSKKLNAAASYNFVDDQVLPGKLQYYKLKIFDDDGSHYFSKTITGRLKSEKAVYLTEIFPNPAYDVVNFEIISTINHAARYDFINNNGQVILSKKLDIRSGVNKMSLPLDRVENGITFLRIHLENEVIIRRFVKTNED